MLLGGSLEPPGALVVVVFVWWQRALPRFAFAFADWGHSREAIDGWMKHGASCWVGHPSPPLGCSSRRSMDG
jgi:hypothetical protein